MYSLVLYAVAATHRTGPLATTISTEMLTSKDLDSLDKQCYLLTVIEWRHPV